MEKSFEFNDGKLSQDLPDKDNVEAFAHQLAHGYNGRIRIILTDDELQHPKHLSIQVEDGCLVGEVPDLIDQPLLEGFIAEMSPSYRGSVKILLDGQCANERKPVKHPGFCCRRIAAGHLIPRKNKVSKD